MAADEWIDHVACDLQLAGHVLNCRMQDLGALRRATGRGADSQSLSEVQLVPEENGVEDPVLNEVQIDRLPVARVGRVIEIEMPGLTRFAQRSIAFAIQRQAAGEERHPPVGLLWEMDAGKGHSPVLVDCAHVETADPVRSELDRLYEDGCTGGDQYRIPDHDVVEDVPEGGNDARCEESCCAAAVRPMSSTGLLRETFVEKLVDADVAADGDVVFEEEICRPLVDNLVLIVREAVQLQRLLTRQRQVQPSERRPSLHMSEAER